MKYLSCHFTVEPLQPGSDILIALLGDTGFESFVNTDTGFDAFIQEDQLNMDEIKHLGDFDFNYSYTIEEIEQKNWNEEWEKNFEPVYVEDKCCIRAPFHPVPQHVQQDILIIPKMSFGTGHHDTTWLMSEALFSLELKNKRVLDMGCGTGVLAILAEKLGAADILAIDIDEWSYENSIENCALNSCFKIKVKQGDSTLLKNESFDVIIANINRNVLLSDMEAYVQSLNKSGCILFSGFFESDIPELQKKAVSLGLQQSYQKVKNNWAMLQFRLIS